MAGVVGLLAALALTATGCSTAPAAAQPVIKPSQEHQKKVSDFDPAMTVLDEDWVHEFGQDRKVSTPIAKAGLKILSMMFDEHPEYTVEGFVPTDGNWNEAAAKLRPLVDDAAFKKLESDWSSKKELPVMTSYRLGKDGKPNYTYHAKSGQTCTDTDKPYATNMEIATLTAGPDANGVQVPVFTGNVTLVVHCQEGGTLKGQMYTWFPMVKAGDTWLMRGEYQSNPAGAFTFE